MRASMRALHEIFEIFSTTTFVIGFLLNLLLLYLIRRFSSKELGTYKYLLEIFAIYDTWLVVVHHVANLKVIPSRTGFSFVSDRDFGVFAIPCFYSSCYAIPFVILNIHLLYRYWTIKEPHKIALFSQKKFVVFLTVLSVLFQIVWFIACFVLGKPYDVEEIRHYQDLFRQEYEREINDGPLIMNYWRDGILQIRPFFLLIIADTVEIVSISIAATLATLTYRELRDAQNISEKFRDFQLQILVAAIAQTVTPVIFVYTPYFYNVNSSLYHIYSPTISAIGIVLLSCFPCIDAVIIIVLMKPYRDGLLRMLGKREVYPIMLPGSAFSTSVQPIPSRLE